MIYVICRSLNWQCKQPAKRRAAEQGESSTPKVRQSKLAKENKISAEEENEIREAFQLFSIKHKGEKEGVIPIDDVRRAMSYVPLYSSTWTSMRHFQLPFLLRTAILEQS